ncbi:HK97 family phage major capsid protein [Williamsia limnetica]|uniref:HK97 family phage major capsid protein n=1 Tax=Williamsia limnetica TaxID=882452 RepID=A0A318RLQ4_WILLI|nr:phage major capsid protein [Williamsia limnetica]PYE19252.1 HK97 family phage major capsid protein [Williamsia limnetica]
MTISKTTGGTGAVSSAEVSSLIIEPLITEAAFGQVSTYVPVKGSSLRIPKVTDGTNAGWVAEGSEINIDNLAITEVPLVFKKLAAIVPVTAELIADAHTEGGGVLTLVGNSLVRQLANKLDLAAFGNTVAEGPNGIQSITGTIDLGDTALTDADIVVDGIAALKANGNTATHVVVSPALAATAAKTKVSTGSAQQLYGPDASQPVAATIQGLPVVADPAVKADALYVVDASRIVLAVRQEATLTTDASVYFSSDRVAVKANLRVGIGWVDPKAIAVATYDAP